MINIKSDSRKIKKGDIFIAVQCEVNDGHKYINKAIENGASKVIAEYGEYSIETLIVDDTRKYMNEYLQSNYNSILEKMTIIGITGTNGKTTSAYLIYQALNKLGIKCAYIGTIGFYMDEKVMDLPNTNPDTCDMYDMIITAHDKGYNYVVLEASSQGLAGGRLEGIPFDYAIFTNLTQDHLDYHKTMENYALAKKILFEKLKENGKSILNYDDDYKKYFITSNTIYYGMTGGDYKITSLELTNTNTKLTINNEYNFVSPLLGNYNAYNILVVISLLSELGISMKKISDNIKDLSSPPGRMDTIKYHDNSIIVDYAHTPDAFLNIIKTAREITDKNIYVVFGCTGDRDRTKRPIMTKIVTDLATSAIITIDDLHNEDPNQIVNDMISGLENTNYEICLDRKEAIIRGINKLEHNDILLILGKGHEEAIIIKDKKIPFNDKRIALDYIKDKQEV